MILFLATLQLATAGALHPNFPLRDADGADVLLSGQPYAPSQTCGACHDTAYIEAHATHADAGMSHSFPPGEGRGALPWETSVGRLGRWDADIYTVAGADDLQTWARSYGLDHVGGGPLGPLGVQMDCALCHLDQANDPARREALANGELALANTATLSGTGLVSIEPSETGPVTWHPEAFAEGLFPADRLDLRDPSAERCGSCHGTVYREPEPLQTPDGRRSRATGLVFSGQHIDDSALNLLDKESLSRSWDVHAERLLECASCHTAPNHPAFRAGAATEPEHLRFDPRKVPLGSYLKRPSHNFTVGSSARIGPSAENAMRSCADCHDPEVGHDFLPDRARHFAALSCETCHVPTVAWTARELLDWTALDADGHPLEDWRGSDGVPEDPAALQRGYAPILLPRTDADGARRLAPYQLATTYLWVSDDAPVPREALTVAWSRDGLLPLFDADGDGLISNSERRLDSDAKVQAIATRLREAGASDPKIFGFVDAYPVSHGVTRGEHVTRACTACHGASSRLNQGMELAAWVPGGVTPSLHGRAASALIGAPLVRKGDALWALPPTHAHRYVFGADRLPWIDWGGLLALLGAVTFVSVHGGLRALSHPTGDES